jgi:hypothetical protein
MASRCLEPNLRDADNHDAMGRLATIDAKLLIQEVERYLAAVEVFRAEGREPSWRRELVPGDVPATRPA